MAAVLTPPKPSFFDHGDRESTKSRSSSLKDFAMRSKRAFMQPMTALLSNKENRGNKTIVQTLPSPPQTPSTSAGPTPRPVVSPSPKVNSKPQQTTEPQNIQTPRLHPAKSKSLLRRMSTAFHKPQPTTDVPAVPSSSLQQKREAALRARGLLPPLANKDLSRQELEQDERCSPCVPLNPESDADLTEAHRIKEQWEAKNRIADVEQRSKLSTFKFGGLASASQPDLTETSQEPNLETLVEVDTPLPSPSPSGRTPMRPPPLKLHLATPMGSMSNPGPEPSDPLAIPLPPSPFPSLYSVRCSSPTLVPLPPSPSASSVVFETGSNELLQPSSPTMSASHGTDESQSRNRSHTLLSPSQESEDGSIYASSHTLTVHTTESASSIGKHKTPARAWTAHDIEVIAESPREEASISPVEVEEKPANLPLPRRRQTDPTGGEKKERRKSVNLFSRAASPSVSVTSSIGSLKRSVVGTLSRRDTRSRTPRSPTFPPPPPRLAVAPTIHSPGSILIEASEIEDEESRQLTENAFLY
ncbi:hypothetical protein BDZ89DRAFT_1156278 [Hymenopellis radicata]|nr:hypothetical protein BDZ89DRAFT_1156278 [Hymenopellis radicata]